MTVPFSTLSGLGAGTAALFRKKLNAWRSVLSATDINRVEDITPHHLRRCLLQLAETHNPGGTHAMFLALRSLLRWWEVETEPLNWSNPLRKVQAPKVPNELLKPLSAADLKAMLVTCDKSSNGQWDEAILLALYGTGCRASEFVTLTVTGNGWQAEHVYWALTGHNADNPTFHDGNLVIRLHRDGCADRFITCISLPRPVQAERATCGVPN
jgi:site-specific recombinase XerD